MINPMDLTGKHIVITGASAGIGRETCIQASKLGAKVSLVARSEEKMNETMSFMEGEGHNLYSFDLNNIDEINDLIENIVVKDGPIDGLVHCAGIGANRPIKLLKPDFIEEMMRIHYFAFVELLRAASMRKRSNDGASYVGISSVAAFHGDRAQGAYSGAKAAMSAVVHSLAKELAHRGIRVNTVAFGMVETDMYKEFLESEGNKENLFNGQYLGIIPVKYAGDAICYMLSDASKYITGGTLKYDAGGLS